MAMRLSAATLLLLQCLVLTAVYRNAQEDLGLDVDGHLRLSGSRPAQYSQGSLQSSTAAYVGLGTAAEAALGDAEQVSNVLMADDAGTAAALMPVSATGRKHRRVNKHGRHSHKRKTADTHDSNSSSHDRKDSDHYYDPSHEENTLKWSDSYSRDKPPEGYKSSSPSRPSGPKPKGYSAPTDPSDEDYYGDNGGRKKYKKQQQRGGSSSGGGGAGSGGDDWFAGGPSGKDDSYDTDNHEGIYKKGGDQYSRGEGYPGSGYTPLASNKNVCKQVLLEEEEVEVVFTPNKDKATVTTLLGTCANPTHPLPTLGGGCVVECHDVADLCNITPLNSHVFAAPANFRSMDNYYPVMCSYRADAPLKAGCNIVMKVACCSDVPKAETDDADKGGKGKTSSGRKAVTKNAAYDDEGDEDDDEPEEYYAIVRSKLLRIPLATQKY